MHLREKILLFGILALPVLATAQQNSKQLPDKKIDYVMQYPMEPIKWDKSTFGGQQSVFLQTQSTLVNKQTEVIQQLAEKIKNLEARVAALELQKESE